MTRTTALPRVLPAVLAGFVLALLVAPVFDPDVQLFFRDTGRLYYPLKRYLTERLRAGQLPLWDPWTESGTSVLGQVTPALFHPFTLLYLVLPFDLAFKLNHVLPLGLAAFGAWLLARRLGCSPWASCVAALGYSCSGYLLSMASTNLIYVVGGGTLPLALDRFLAFEERPSGARLLVASAVLGSCMLGGEPQSMLFAAVLGGGWALGARARRTPRERLSAVPKVALRGIAWCACAVLLSGPASFPALARLRTNHRATGLDFRERALFANSPQRLVGLALPQVADEGLASLASDSDTFGEYFSSEPGVAFGSSILLGFPLLLLALISLRRGGGGLALMAGAAVFALASCGDHLPVAQVVGLLPGFHLFRYAEKFILPVSLLLSLAAARGAQLAADDRTARRALLTASALCAGACLAGTLVAYLRGDLLARELASLGATGNAAIARDMVGRVQLGCLVEGALCLTLAFASRAAAGSLALPLFALVQIASVLATQAGKFDLSPIEFFRNRPKLARRFEAESGPSEHRWRLGSIASHVRTERSLRSRLASEMETQQLLNPQYESLWRIEGVANYFSADDEPYLLGFREAPAAFVDLFGVAYLILSTGDMNAAEAARLGYTWTPPGRWIRRHPLRKRVFVASEVVVADSLQRTFSLLRDGPESLRTRVVVGAHEADLANATRAAPGVAEVTARPSPELARFETASGARSVLVWAEHFDPGWRATVDGVPARTFAADAALVGVALPPGRHRVELQFWPVGLTAGFIALCSTLGAFAAACLVRAARLRHSR